MIEFEPPHSYDVVIFAQQSIQTLPKSAIPEMLSKCQKVLSRNGVIVVTLFDPEPEKLVAHKERIWGAKNTEDGDSLIAFVDEVSFDAERVSYRCTVKRYDTRGFLLESLADHFSIANVDSAFVDELTDHRSLELVSGHCDCPHSWLVPESLSYNLILAVCHRRS
jgi:hypothetical protein